MAKDASARCVVSRFLRRIGSTGSSHKRTPSSAGSSTTDIDDQPPISPSDTLVEKMDRSLPEPTSYAGRGGPCACGGGSWVYPTPVRPSRSPSLLSTDEPLSQEAVDTITSAIDDLSPSLRTLSLDIWDNPEHGYEERHAHSVLTKFMSNQGFTITEHYLGLETAWRAEYSRGKGGRVIGVNSEMDALPGLGHACGHNLIAVSGVAVAIALKRAIDKHNISATIILLGTPAEEFGGGKTRLLNLGAYDKMDICVMSHPGPGKPNGALISPWMALQNLEVEFTGHSAHAAYSPWEAQNALDAAFLAYSSVSVLRQQLKPTSRVHGIVTGRDWEPNVIPDYAKMRWIVRAPTFTEVESLRAKVTACFEAAALATSCKVKVVLGEAYHDVRQSPELGDEFCRILGTHLGMVGDVSDTTLPASSDFGLVSYTIPSIQPVVSIPIQPNGGNHTPQFAESARTPEAHEACMKVSKGLALTAFRVVQDDEFYHQVKQGFERSKLGYLPQGPEA